MSKMWYIYSDYGHGDTGFIAMTEDPSEVSQIVKEHSGWDYTVDDYDDPPNMSITLVPL